MGLAAVPEDRIPMPSPADPSATTDRVPAVEMDDERARRGRRPRLVLSPGGEGAAPGL